jgi:hypothetical protein
MLTLTAGQIAALQSNRCIRRIFMRFDVLVLSGPGHGDTQTFGFWDDDYPITVASQLYHPVGDLPQIGNIEGTTDLSIPRFDVSMPGLDVQIWDLLFSGTYAWHQKSVELDIGIYDPATRTLVDDLIHLLKGYWDKSVVSTSGAGGKAVAKISVESVAREVNRYNPSVRSPRDQRLRNPNDKFFDLMNESKDDELQWGQRSTTGANNTGG